MGMRESVSGDTWLDAFPDWKVEVVGVRDDREGHRPAARGPALAARLGITTALTVPLMTWVVMPRVTRLLRGWLYPEREVP